MQNLSRNGTSDDPEFVDIHWVARLVYIIIGILMIVIAVAGNSLFLFVLYKQYKRCPANHLIFLANLCLGDLVIMGYWYPFYVVDLILNRGSVLSDAHCVVNGVIVITQYMLSIFSLLLIAVNRYVRVCRSIVYKHVFTRSHTWAAIVSVWLGSLLFALLPIIDGMESTSYGYDPVGRGCSLTGEAFSYPVVLIVLFATLPMLFIAYCNFAIFRYWRHLQQASIPKREGPELVSDRGNDFSDRKTERIRGNDFSDRKTERICQWKPQSKESKSEASSSRPKSLELPAREVLESVVLQNKAQGSHVEMPGSQSCVMRGVAGMFSARIDRLVMNSSLFSFEWEPYAVDSKEQRALEMDRDDVLEAVEEVFGHENDHSEEDRFPTPPHTPVPSLASSPVTSNVSFVSLGRQERKRKLPVVLDVRDVTTQLHEIHAKVKAREMAFIRALFVVFILAVCTYIPYDVIIIAGYFVSLPPEVSMLGNLFLFTNSCLNWAIYGAMNPGLKRGCRRYMKRLLTGRLKTGNKSTFSLTSIAS